MKKKLIYSIGIGTGDPELITIKAIRLLEQSDIVFVPQSNRSGRSIAREIVLHYVGDEKLSMYFFPMNNDKDDLFRRYSELAEKMNHLLELGNRVSYVTMGDPTIFSTSNYLTERLVTLGIEVKHVPGINSINAVSTTLGLPLCIKGENFAVYEMPGDVESAVNLIKSHSTTIFMKVNNKLPILLETVKTSNPEVAYLVRRMGLADEKVFNLLEAGMSPDAAYLSVALIKQKTKRHFNP